MVGWFGDRMNELVFIGQNIDKPALIDELSACLITDEEIEACQHQELFNTRLKLYFDNRAIVCYCFTWCHLLKHDKHLMIAFKQVGNVAVSLLIPML